MPEGKRMSAVVRELLPTEIAFFEEHGWAFLPGLISAEAATELQAHAERMMAGQSAYANYAFDTDGAFSIFRRPDQSHALARGIALSPEMGRNASRLLLGGPRVRLLQSSFLVKSGRGSGKPSGSTTYHQDFPAHPLDRSEMANFWIAVTPIVPEMGSLRFYSGSRRAGALGKCFMEPGDDTQNRYPGVRAFPLSQPLSMAPGDATVHHGLTVHGAPENATGRIRIAMSMTYFDAAARYTGAPFATMDGLGLKVDAPFDHPEYPLIENQDA
jgi:hypothetical protein